MRELEIANSELVGKAEGYDCTIEFLIALNSVGKRKH